MAGDFHTVLGLKVNYRGFSRFINLRFQPHSYTSLYFTSSSDALFSKPDNEASYFERIITLKQPVSRRMKAHGISKIATLSNEPKNTTHSRQCLHPLPIIPPLFLEKTLEQCSLKRCQVIAVIKLSRESVKKGKVYRPEITCIHKPRFFEFSKIRSTRARTHLWQS